MPSEIITTKRDTEIGRLLERVVRDHRKDIAAYSKGHLNENNLYRPPESGLISWETAKLPAIKLKQPLAVRKELRDGTMWDAVACFSRGSPFKTDLPSRPATQCKSPVIEVDRDNINLEEFDASYIMLPTDNGYKVLPSLHSSFRKKEELEQMRMFDDQVVDKRNLTDRGWYDGSRATRHIKPSVPSIQIGSKLWGELLQSCTSYNPLLSEIQLFYEGYLSFLRQDSKSNVSPSKQTDGFQLKHSEISWLSDHIQQLECRAMKLLNTNELLKEEHGATETVLSEIRLQTDAADTVSSGGSSLRSEPLTIASNVEQLRREILLKRAEIQNLHKMQRSVMVPMEVYQCMVQCVQSSEIEFQKQTKATEVLRKKRIKYGSAVEEALAETGFSEEQTNQLLSLIP